MEQVELKQDGAAYIIVIDGEAKLKRNADGTWSSSEPGWKIRPTPLLGSRSGQSWDGWEFIKPDRTRLDHVFGLKEDGTGFIVAIAETRRME